MQKSYYTNKPEPLLIQRHTNTLGEQYIHVTVTANAEEVEGEEFSHWEADTHQFWEKKEALDLADVQANPENYLHYVPLATRQEGKGKAQQLLDALRGSCPVVPVPSYREGAAVCNRPADQVKLVAGLAMGGLPYYELASGDIVSLSTEDIQAIAADITAAETAWQQAKQACWAAIDAAQGEEGIATALAELEARLRSPNATAPATNTDVTTETP